MEFIFILVIVAVVAAVLGGGLWAMAGGLRKRQLHPEENKLASLEGGEPQPRGERPRHVRAENEQHARLLGRR